LTGWKDNRREADTQAASTTAMDLLIAGRRNTSEAMHSFERMSERDERCQVEIEIQDASPPMDGRRE
jgi:phage shock protein A